MPLAEAIGTERRRSRRVPLSVPIDVTNLDSSALFSGCCNTIDVSFHGCQFFLTCPFKRGTRLLLYALGAHHTASACVVRSMPALPDMNARIWKIAVDLVSPGNYWGVEHPPSDWAL